ncbi:MAG: hypothetical protein ACK5Q5_18975 [Planctomycetaceae bacterium]
MSALLSMAQRSLSSGLRGDIGFRMSIEGAKAIFFDWEAIKDNALRAEEKALSRFGYFTMRDARQSIRNPTKKRRGTFSDPGKPPFNQTGLLKKFIYFGYDQARHSVVIGPTMLEGHIRFLQIPRVLEEGGKSRWTVKRPPGEGRGKRKQANIYKGTINIRPRPYMKPAFDAAKAELLPGLWKNAIRK